MAEIDTGGREQKSSGGLLGVIRKKSRVGIHMDMTPMVDIAFLLLIFFMVTTVFRPPLAMEINLPESDATVQVPSDPDTSIVPAGTATRSSAGDDGVRIVSG